MLHRSRAAEPGAVSCSAAGCSEPFDPIADPPVPIFGIGDDVVTESCADFEVDAVFRRVGLIRFRGHVD